MAPISRSQEFSREEVGIALRNPACNSNGCVIRSRP